MWKPAGPTASTFATSTVRSLRSMASLNRSEKSCTVLAVAVCSTPEARAMPAKSVPVEVAVGKPPTDNRAFVVEDDHREVARAVAGQGAEASQVHQHRAVPIKDYDLLVRER